jgi:adenylyltransferase and sulfurtransferase
MSTREDEDNLSQRIRELEQELERLRLQQIAQRQQHTEIPKSNPNILLERHEYIRYGRQMIIPKIGLPGQLALRKSSALVIGAGGLGCPVLLYLVAAGIGT